MLSKALIDLCATNEPFLVVGCRLSLSAISCRPDKEHACFLAESRELIAESLSEARFI